MYFTARYWRRDDRVTLVPTSTSTWVASSGRQLSGKSWATTRWRTRRSVWNSTWTHPTNGKSRPGRRHGRRRPRVGGLSQKIRLKRWSTSLLSRTKYHQRHPWRPRPHASPSSCRIPIRISRPPKSPTKKSAGRPRSEPATMLPKCERRPDDRHRHTAAANWASEGRHHRRSRSSGRRAARASNFQRGCARRATPTRRRGRN